MNKIGELEKSLGAESSFAPCEYMPMQNIEREDIVPTDAWGAQHFAFSTVPLLRLCRGYKHRRVSASKFPFSSSD